MLIINTTTISQNSRMTDTLCVTDGLWSRTNEKLIIPSWLSQFDVDVDCYNILFYKKLYHRFSCIHGMAAKKSLHCTYFLGWKRCSSMDYNMNISLVALISMDLSYSRFQGVTTKSPQYLEQDNNITLNSRIRSFPTLGLPLE